jgi:16S rRNA (cytosine1402-N4)-methyltransferase
LVAEPVHVPVLPGEVIEALALEGARARGVYVDGTFGRGGHSRAILERLAPEGRLVALDRDPAAVAAAAAIDDPRFAIVHAAFADLATVLRERGIARVDGVLLDLGLSSPQLEEPERGFSFRRDGPLDMRMDTTRGATAAEWLAAADERTIAEVISSHGEERYAQSIARALVAARAQQPIARTGQLAAIVGAAVRSREPGQDPATRTFQALRIHVNQELAQLSLALPQAVDALAPGGRLVVISFHSLEDRIVKRFLRAASQPPALPPRLPVRAIDLPRPRLALLGRARRPAAAEVARNPRARSAVLRAAERLA